MYKNESDSKYQFEKYLFKHVFTIDFDDKYTKNKLRDKDIKQIVVLLKEIIY